ncbi:MAG: tetratricopeptide repeat protein [Syntrophales bacterium]
MKSPEISIMNRDIEARDEFLSLAEVYLKQNLFQVVLDMARDRLNSAPNEVDARIVLYRALVGLKRDEEASGILKDIESDFLRWSPVYELLGDVCCRRGLKEEAKRYYEIFELLNPGSSRHGEIAERMESLAEADPQSKEPDSKEYTPEISSDFRTVTMAELFIRQGHPDTARQILEEILKTDPGNESVLEKLREAETMLNQGRTGEVSGKREAVIRELNAWLGKIKRSRGNVPAPASIP